ncbi:ER membrane protein [Purpureocillium lilacinum]|nr:ER membrane protein [Purpureocillium lilacinum]
MVTPFQLFYSFRAVFVKSQYWRLVTTFLYFGPFSLDLLFHIYFLQRYARLLEESSGRSPAHFSWLLLYAMASLIALSPLVSMPFLGHPLSSTLVYIWSRRNPDTRLSFLGLLVFTAPYLPWVLMAFSLFMHGTIPRDEIMGVVIGHVWYFFTDVYPPLHNGSRPLDPPGWWRRLFEGGGPADSDNGINNDVAAAGARDAAGPVMPGGVQAFTGQRSTRLFTLDPQQHFMESFMDHCSAVLCVAALRVHQTLWIGGVVAMIPKEAASRPFPMLAHRGVLGYNRLGISVSSGYTHWRPGQHGSYRVCRPPIQGQDRADGSPRQDVADVVSWRRLQMRPGGARGTAMAASMIGEQVFAWQKRGDKGQFQTLPRAGQTISGLLAACASRGADDY